MSQRIINFLARYRGLPVLIGLGMIVLNFVLRLLPAWPVVGWLAGVDLFLHLGLVVSLIGVLLIRAL
ncbi:MAG: hypothetical protein JXD18_15535 [Anaerolineae bacterium]|nr:hypothetical protein [Anaerolineae bacterium]